MYKLIKKILKYGGYEIIKPDTRLVKDGLPTDFSKQVVKIIKDTQQFTLTSPERISALVNAVNYIVENNIEGDIVECGVWKGGSSMAAMLALKENKDETRSVYLYDTYEGMSEPTEADKSLSGASAFQLLNESDKQNSKSVWCYSSLDEVKDNISKVNYPENKIHFVKGKVEDTIPGVIPEKIAILRLDTDWYESTKHELIHLYPRLVSGGVLIIDDYGHWEGAKRAVDEYIKEFNLRILLNRVDYTGRVAIKP